MCILSIGENDETSEALAALAHNLETVKGDVQQAKRILEVRNPEKLVEFAKFSANIETLADTAWDFWKEFIPVCPVHSEHNEQHAHN